REEATEPQEPQALAHGAVRIRYDRESEAERLQTLQRSGHVRRHERPQPTLALHLPDHGDRFVDPMRWRAACQEHGAQEAIEPRGVIGGGDTPPTSPPARPP